MEDYLSSYDSYSTEIPEIPEPDIKRLQLQEKYRQNQRMKEDDTTTDTIAAANASAAMKAGMSEGVPRPYTPSSRKNNGLSSNSMSGAKNFLNNIFGGTEATAYDPGSSVVGSEFDLAEVGGYGNPGTEYGVSSGAAESGELIGGETVTEGAGGGLLGGIGIAGTAAIGGTAAREYLGSNSGTQLFSGSIHEDWKGIGGMFDNLWKGIGDFSENGFTTENLGNLSEPGFWSMFGFPLGYGSGMGSWDPFNDVSGWFGIDATENEDKR
jgi:hypothetical protein